MKVLLRLLGPVAAVMALGACTTEGTSPVATHNDTDPPTTIEAAFICEREGYPCTLGEVPDSVLHRSDALLEEANGKLQSGDSFQDLLGWIQTQAGVVEAWVGETELYFRLEGGVPTWLFVPPPDSGQASAAPIPPRLASRGVVGRGTNRDGDAPHKNALLIYPYGYQTSFSGLIGPVNDTLVQVPDYTGRVTIEQNDTLPAVPPVGGTTGLVTVEDFIGWNDYDLVYVGTHSHGLKRDNSYCAPTRALPDESCLWALLTTQRVRECSYVKTRYPTARGIRCVKPEGRVGFTLNLTEEFFADRYGQGGGRPLDGTVVYMDSCRGFENDGVARHIGGSSSAYMGWAGLTFCGSGTNASVALLKLLARGYTARQAVQQINRAGFHGTELKLTSGGNDLRIRELPELQHPHSRVRLEDGILVPILGTPSDDYDDALMFVVEVTGVIDPKATGGSSGNAAELYEVRLFVDGNEVGRANLGRPPQDRAEVDLLDDVRYRLTYIADLPFDVPDEGRWATLKAEIPLPEGGKTWHEVDVTLSGGGCEFHVLMSGDRTEDIVARNVKLTEPGDLLLFGTADAALAEDGSGLVMLQFDGPLEGRTFRGDFLRGRWPPIPAGTTGAFELNGGAAIEDGGGGYEVVNIAPIFSDDQWQPLQLTIFEFTEDHVTGRITGEVRELVQGFLTPTSMLTIDFRALTKVGTTTATPCLGF